MVESLFSSLKGPVAIAADDVQFFKKKKFFKENEA